jgi:hypothetical protein
LAFQELFVEFDVAHHFGAADLVHVTVFGKQYSFADKDAVEAVGDYIEVSVEACILGLLLAERFGDGVALALYAFRVIAG